MADPCQYITQQADDMQNGNTPVQLFTDLATYDVIDNKIYAGHDAFNLFSKAVRKAGWTARTPLPLIQMAQGSFGETQTHEVPRTVDYLGFSWLHWKTPLLQSANGYQLRWTPKLGFYVFQEIQVMSNELPITTIYPEVLDFESELLVDEGKYEGLMYMIGHRPSLMNPYINLGQAQTANGSRDLPSEWITSPFSCWFTKKANDHLPIAAMSFNTVTFKAKVRDLSEILIADNIQNTPQGWVVTSINKSLSSSMIANQGSNIKMGRVQSFAMIVQMPNRDRKIIARTPSIDLLIQQTNRIISYNYDTKRGQLKTDIRFTQPVRAIYYGLRNATYPSEWGNWTDRATEPLPSPLFGVDFAPLRVDHPIAGARIDYDVQARVTMTQDFYAYLVPYLSCLRIPRSKGYGLWSYALWLDGNQPDMSANFSRISNPTLVIQPNCWASDPLNTANTYNLHVMCVAWNNFRVTLGSGSFGCS